MLAGHGDGVCCEAVESLWTGTGKAVTANV